MLEASPKLIACQNTQSSLFLSRLPGLVTLAR